MWTELTPELIELTPHQATLHKNRRSLPGDRDVSTPEGRRRIAWLESHLRRGNFITPTWAIAQVGGAWWRIDGGHSSHMLAASNGNFPHGKSVLLRKFKCESNEDLADLFNIFDNRKSLRTLGDKINAHKSVKPKLVDIPKSYVQAVTAGICIFRSGGVSRQTDEEERVAVMHGEEDFIVWASGFVKGKHMRRPAVIGAMRHIYGVCGQDHLDEATEFWSGVRDIAGEHAKVPTRKLGAFLINLSERDNPWRNQSHAIYSKCITAWNAHLQGATTLLKYHPSSRAVPACPGRH
jgi:hypothetical protein